MLIPLMDGPIIGWVWHISSYAEVVEGLNYLTLTDAVVNLHPYVADTKQSPMIYLSVSNTGS